MTYKAFVTSMAFAFGLFTASSSGAADFGRIDPRLTLPVDYQVLRTCAYFDALAFQDRHAGRTDTPRVRVATSCRSAFDIRRLALNGSDSQRLANHHLTSLVHFRDELLSIGAERFWAARKGRPFKTRLTGLSETGFYLMAKRNGLFDQNTALQSVFETAYYPVANRPAKLVD